MDLELLLKSQNACSSQLRRLEALRALCSQSSECIALALVGSFAQGKGDRISDLDLIAFVKEGSEDELITQAHQLLMQQPVLHQCGLHRPGRVALRKYVFLDASSCEFHAFNSTGAFRLKRPFIPIWDPTNFLETLVVNEPPPRHEDFEAYPHGDEGLIWELFDCIKWLQRGRTALAKDYLRKLVRAIDKGNSPAHQSSEA
jgi:hypothetical protein